MRMPISAENSGDKKDYFKEKTNKEKSNIKPTLPNQFKWQCKDLNVEYIRHSGSLCEVRRESDVGT